MLMDATALEDEQDKVHSRKNRPCRIEYQMKYRP